MKTTRRHLTMLGASAGLSAALPSGLAAQGRTPLLMEGKKTLYQRVLVRPNTILSDQPGGGGRTEPARPFDLFYVFESRSTAGAEWLMVAPGRNGVGGKWLLASGTIPWKQTIVVQFTNPAGRGLSLILRDKDDVRRLLADSQPLAAMRERASRKALLPTDPVVAMEPGAEVDQRRRFYLLPILGHEMAIAGGKEARALQVACVSIAEPPPPLPQQQFRAGLVFVIDTTISMRPYIERTREALRRMYDRLQNSPIAGKLSVGVVGYRNSVEKTPGLEYRTKVFVPLEPNQNPVSVLGRFDSVREAKVSSHEIRDDAYSGIQTALHSPEMKWDAFDARYVILVTDSGPLPYSDPWSARLEPTTLHDHAVKLKISLSVLHLITPPNKQIYPTVIPQIKALCAGGESDSSPRYFPVLNGSETSFLDQVSRLADHMITGIQTMADGRTVEVGQQQGDLDRLMLQDTLAMQLAYLGRQKNERAPDVIKGWIADRALEDTSLETVKVCVLMSKNELSTLSAVLAQIIDEGERTRDDSLRFFDRVRAALARMARDPARLRESDQVINTQFSTLGQAMGEFLQDLPYQSLLQSISQEEWVGKSQAHQREILDLLNLKRSYFEKWHDDDRLWTAFYPGAPPGETVLAMPLSSLP